MTKINEIPYELALELCEEVRENNKNKKFSFGKIQCHFCWNYAKKIDENGKISNICVLNAGCSQSNKLLRAKRN